MSASTNATDASATLAEDLSKLAVGATTTTSDATASPTGDATPEPKAETKDSAEDAEEDGDDADDTGAPAEGGAGGEGKKKKKKKKKNKNKGGAAGGDGAAVGASAGTVATNGEAKPADESEEKNSLYFARAVNRNPPEGTKPLRSKSGAFQTSPPAIPVNQFYPNNIFPTGQILKYPQDFNTYRETDAEKKSVDKLCEAMYNEVREAAEVHRQCRQDLQKFIQPGRSLTEIAERLEASTATLIRKDKDGLVRGRAFPTGLSLNHIAAHFSPNAGDKTIVKENDVLKVDFGTHINGRIIDCAFTVHFNPEYDELVNAVKEACNVAVEAAGIDVRLGDVGGAMQEVLEAAECTIKGKTYPVKPIKNLNGHNIRPYKIHGGKSVPCYNNHDQTKMEEGEFFAFEPFASVNGRGQVYDDLECSHYMKAWDLAHPPQIRNPKARDLMKVIDKNFGTLAFCRRWLDELGEKMYGLPLKLLCDSGAVNPYPPLVETKNAYTAQFEHTVLLRPTCKEVLSRGFDY